FFEDPYTRARFEEFIRGFLGMSVFHASDCWLPNGDNQLFLACSSVQDASLVKWTSYSASVTFASGVGIPGRVLATQASQWQAEYSKVDPDRNPLCHIASTLGIRTAFGVPIPVGNGKAGVIMFYSKNSLPPSELMLGFVERAVRMLLGDLPAPSPAVLSHAASLGRVAGAYNQHARWQEQAAAQRLQGDGGSVAGGGGAGAGLAMLGKGANGGGGGGGGGGFFGGGGITSAPSSLSTQYYSNQALRRFSTGGSMAAARATAAAAAAAAATTATTSADDAMMDETDTDRVMERRRHVPDGRLWQGNGPPAALLPRARRLAPLPAPGLQQVRPGQHQVLHRARRRPPLHVPGLQQGRPRQFPACTKSAQSSTNFCVRHGGGRKCQVTGCQKVARGRTRYCAAHGGGVRCRVDGCNKAAVGKYQMCRTHSGQSVPAAAAGAVGVVVAQLAA
ncbi:unnamed protein product, partial [Phaeothamnion confervicola]